jgi:hypothetical protein
MVGWTIVFWLDDLVWNVSPLNSFVLISHIFLLSLGEDLSWENMFAHPSGREDEITMGLVWVMLIVDIAIYSIVTWYIDSIMPGKYGVAKPWYFFVMV